jgi:hypothetical protein
MAKYKIIVPFEPIIFETLSSSTTTKLAESFSLAGIKVNEKKEGEFYEAEVGVEATGNSEAELLAVYRVEELLNLFAVWNDGFKILFSGIKSEKIETEDQADSVKIIEGEDNVLHIYLKETIGLREHLSVEKRKNNFEFEEGALKWRDEWVDWLKVALKLNYLAVISRELIPSLILRYSALETITENILGSPESLLKSKFKERNKEKEEFLKAINKIFIEHGLENKSEHLMNRILETHEEGKNKRIQEALKICKIEAQIQDINFVSRQRGKMVHPIKSSEVDDLTRAISLAEKWIRESLQFILSNPKFIIR